MKAVNDVMKLALLPDSRLKFWLDNIVGLDPIKSMIMVFVLLLPFSAIASYPGIHDDRIVLGQSAALTGENQILGLNYSLGILAAFEEKNQNGGIMGRKLELMQLDDAYESELATRNAEKIVEENDVFVVIGGVGTPTARRIVPILRDADIPYVGPLTGANFLHDFYYSPNVVNLRSSYRDEVRVMVDHFIHDLGFSRFGIIYQEDAFGQSVYEDLKHVLDRFNLPILARASFARNSHAVHAGLFTFQKVDLDAIFIIGTYATNSEIINLSTSLAHDYSIANLSFVNSDELKSRLNFPNDNIYITEVVPDPLDSTYPITNSMNRALKNPDLGKFFEEYPSFEFSANEVTLEGYILGRYVIEMLERMEGNLTRNHFMEVALSPGKIEIDGWVLDFKEGSNTGSDYIRLTNILE